MAFKKNILGVNQEVKPVQKSENQSLPGYLTEMGIRWVVFYNYNQYIHLLFSFPTKQSPV